MKFIKEHKKLSIIILIVLFVSLIIIFPVRILVQNNIKNRKAEELSSFSYESKLFTLNDDYSYTFQLLVTVQEVNGIETIKYQKDGKEITVNGNGKQKIAIDYIAIENTNYEFKIKPIGQTEKTETVNITRKYATTNTYKLVNGVYVNTPFLENFNEKYTRYASLNTNRYLTPGNWIYDTEPTNWYDYNNQEWANIYVEAEGVESYYVWVPRYVYKLDQTTQKSDVKFVDVYNNYTDSNTGVTTYKELISQGYKLPEAFTWGDSEAIELSGYWISKYQLSDTDTFKIDYNMTASANSIVLSNFINTVSTNSEKFTYALDGKIVNTSTTLEDYTFTGLTENNSYIVNVTALNANGEIVGSMTKTLEPTEVNPPDLTGFDLDTTFYVYWDENGIEHNEVPISKDAPQEWYNYTYSNWANIVTRSDGLESYYVWVPRYQYKLKQQSQKTDVKFIIGTSNATETGYKIPEAFWWDKNDDGIEDNGEQLTGYWIAKYQLSTEESTAPISAEISAGSNIIQIKDIKGTKLTTTDSTGNIIDVPLTYYYYLNGDEVHTGISPTEKYSYTGLSPNTMYTINIIARNTSTNEYVGAITKKIKTIDANIPDLTGYNSSNTYYVIYDDSGDTIANYISIVESIPNKWYDYSQNKWANILITDGTVNGNIITDQTYTNYFVWIPRYEYRILTDRTNESLTNKRTDLNFLSGITTETSTGYKIPEAFWWDKNDDGIEDDGEQLTGYWMSKYQLSD